ncbi:MAG: thiol-disulfide isomerase/thioredoxin [Planctomycetota bacterium]|jgi:thiol-disulfide isomerase/thioredoxin
MVHKFLGRVVAAGAVLLAASCASPGDVAPAPSNHTGLQFVDDSGTSHVLGGRAATFVFWQPWCAACREEAPTAVAASVELADSMSFYGVVSGPDGSVDEDLYLKSIDELGLSYPQIRDKDLALTKRFSVTKTPTIIVIDSAGQLRFKGSHMPENLASMK